MSWQVETLISRISGSTGAAHTGSAISALESLLSEERALLAKDCERIAAQKFEAKAFELMRNADEAVAKARASSDERIAFLEAQLAISEVRHAQYS